MAAFEVLALDTATPQIRAPGAGDTYTFPRAVELPLGTANGVLYLDGSKVVTSGSNLTFDGAVLSTGGAAGNGRVYVTNSVGGYSLGLMGASKAIRVEHTATQSNISGVDSSLVGSYEPIMLNGSIVLLGINGGEQMRLNSTGLGIGTSNPQARLTVGSGNFALSNLGTGLTGSTPATGTQKLILGGNSSNGVGGEIGWYVNTSFNGDIAQITAIATAFGTSGAGALIFRTNSGLEATPSERMRLDASGNLGLGVTPSAFSSGYRAIQIGGGTNNYFAVAAQGINSCEGNLLWNAYSTGAETFAYFKTGDNATRFRQQYEFRWFIAPSGTAGNAISFTQAMTLTANGNLLIGTTSDTGALCVVKGSAGAEVARLQNSGGFGLRIVPQIGGSGSVTAIRTGSGESIRFDTNDTERALIDSNGNVIINTAAIATNATDGFLYVPTCAGTPTGTPTTYTGRSPIVVDSTNNKLYFYSGGAWRDAGP